MINIDWLIGNLRVYTTQLEEEVKRLRPIEEEARNLRVKVAELEVELAKRAPG